MEGLELKLFMEVLKVLLALAEGEQAQAVSQCNFRLLNIEQRRSAAAVRGAPQGPKLLLLPKKGQGVA